MKRTHHARVVAMILLAELGVGSCAASGLRVSDVPSVPLIAPDGTTVDAAYFAKRSPETVLIFFSSHCHCLDAHQGRIIALFDEFHRRGVEFAMIDSEVGASIARDNIESQRRGYAFPILLDRGAKLADALGAEYATYSVVIDSRGRVRYRGGLDSDKMHLHDDAQQFVRSALDDLLAGRSVRVPEGKTLGCALERW